MAFTEEQQSFIREIVREVIPEILTTHLATCPYGRQLSRAFWLGLGIGLGSGILSVGSILMIAGKGNL